MEIYYCEGCGSRVEEAEIQSALALRTPSGGYICPRCADAAREASTASGGVVSPGGGEAEAQQIDLSEQAGPAEAVQVAEDIEVAEPVEEGAEPRPSRRARGAPQRLSRRRTTSRRPDRRGRGDPRSRMIKVSIAGAAASCLAAFAVIAILVREKTPSPSDGTDAGIAAEDGASTEGEADGPEGPGAEGEEDTTGEAPGTEATDGAGGPGAEGDPQEDLKAKAARGAFEEVEALAKQGEVGEAERKLKNVRSLFAGTDYERRARALIGNAKAELAIAEVAKLWRAKEYVEALSLTERALDGATSAELTTRLKELSEDLRKKLRAEEEAERRRLAEEEAERVRMIEDRRKAELRRQEERKRELYEDLRRQGKEAASRGDHDKAIGFFERARGHLKTEDILSDILQVRQDVQLAEARRLIEKGEVEAGVAAYEKAAAMKPSAEIAEALVRIMERKDFLVLLGRAEKLSARGEWKGAKAAYLKAGEFAAGRKDKERIAKALIELSFSETCAEAERLAKSGRWVEAVARAREALEIKARAPRARRVVARAKEALRPRGEVTNSIGMRLLLVPDGTFIMGSEEGRADEAPVHRVRLSAYYIGMTEVTNAQYEMFDPAHKSRRPPESPGEAHPVVDVSYVEATAFCDWLTEKEGHRYRLPTEAEWEHAARGLGDRTYPWGYEPPGELGTCRCNFAMRARKGPGRDGFLYAAPVGTYAEWLSPHGCLDMAGNVAEWCLDWYHPGYYENSPAADPTGPEKKASGRVVRGGSWESGPAGVRSAARARERPGARGPALGFRVAREVVKFLKD